MKNIFKKLLILTLAIAMAMCFSNLLCRPLGTSAAEASSSNKVFAKKILKDTRVKSIGGFEFPIINSTDGNLTSIPDGYPSGYEYDENDPLSNYVSGYDKNYLKIVSLEYNSSGKYVYRVYEEITEQGGGFFIRNQPGLACIRLFYNLLSNVGPTPPQEELEYYLVVNDSTAPYLGINRSLFSQDVAVYGAQLYTSNVTNYLDGRYIDILGTELDYDRVRLNTNGSLSSVHSIFPDDSVFKDDMIVENPIGENPTTYEDYQIETISVFDGSVDTKYPSNSGSKTISGVKIDWKGMTSGTSISSTVNGKTYNLAWKTSGSSNSIKFSIPKNVVAFTLYTVVAPNGSTAVDVNFGGNKLYTTGKSNTEYTFNTTDALASGDYELTFKNTPRIAEISLQVYIDPNYQEPTEPTPDNPQESIYPLTVAFAYMDDNNEQQVIHICPSKDEGFNLDTFELPIPDVKDSTFKGWYSDNGTFKDEFTLEEFKALDFDTYYTYEEHQLNVYAKQEVKTETTKPDENQEGNGNSQIEDYNLDFSKWDPKNIFENIGRFFKNPAKFVSKFGEAMKEPINWLFLILKIVVVVVVGVLIFKGIKALVDFFRDK